MVSASSRGVVSAIVTLRSTEGCSFTRSWACVSLARESFARLRARVFSELSGPLTQRHGVTGAIKRGRAARRPRIFINCKTGFVARTRHRRPQALHHKSIGDFIVETCAAPTAAHFRTTPAMSVYRRNENRRSWPSSPNSSSFGPMPQGCLQ